MSPVPEEPQPPATNRKLVALVIALSLASGLGLVVDAGLRYGFSNLWAWQL